jgi:hypothetical protein
MGRRPRLQLGDPDPQPGVLRAQLRVAGAQRRDMIAHRVQRPVQAGEPFGAPPLSVVGIRHDSPLRRW